MITTHPYITHSIHILANKILTINCITHYSANYYMLFPKVHQTRLIHHQHFKVITYSCSRMHVHTHTSVCLKLLAHNYAYACTHAGTAYMICSHLCTHTYPHICLHIQLCKHLHICSHTHSHMFTHTCV